MPKWTVRYNGLLDFDQLYESLKNWLLTYNYDFFEKKFTHKVPSPYGAEQEIEWKGSKEVTHYFKYTIELAFHFWDMKEVIVEKDKKKKRLIHARVEISLKGKLTYDWQKKFEKNKLMKRLKEFYTNTLLKTELDRHHDALYYRMESLHTYIKTLLDMQSKWDAYKGYLKGER